MHRTYTDHRPGERCINIQIGETEIYGLLHDLNPTTLDGYEFAFPLYQLLREARDDFQRRTVQRPRATRGPS